MLEGGQQGAQKWFIEEGSGGRGVVVNEVIIKIIE